MNNWYNHQRPPIPSSNYPPRQQPYHIPSNFASHHQNYYWNQRWNHPQNHPWNQLQNQPQNQPWNHGNHPQNQPWNQPCNQGNQLCNQPWNPADVEKTEKSRDEIVSDFLKQIEKSEKPKFVSKLSSNGNQFLKIRESQLLVEEAEDLILKLKRVDESTTGTEEVKNMKLRLQLLTSILQDEEVVEDLQKKLQKRKNKRLRIKDRKKIELEKSLDEKQEWKKREEEINKSLEKKRRETEDQIREENVQKEILETLSDIKKEERQVSSSLQMITTLAKLRKARMKSRLNEGKVIPKTLSSNFDEKVAKLVSKLNSHREDCLKQEASLRVFKEAEERKIKNKIEKERLEKQRSVEEEWKKRRFEVLFGSYESPIDVFNPLWASFQLHHQSELNIESLRMYREKWDQFVNWEEGYCVPVDWVEPCAPSNPQWKHYVEDI